ncbi:MAG TPA: potassium channel family protein [Sphingomicrobium sp.]|jgi:voltage-gated potassium channel|nr:potassium channel family protein [Sphingomicrobium sp.]
MERRNPTRLLATSSLTRSSGRSPWRSLTFRVLLALGLVALAFSLLWFDRDGLKDNIDGHLSFADVIYFTAITVTTVGYGDIVPVTEKARLIDALFITPIRLFVWLLFIGTAYDFLLRRSWERWRMRRIQKTLDNHIVLAGFGSSGSKAFAELIASGTSAERIVVVDCLAEAIEHARDAGAAVIQGDASSNAILSAVHIERASTLLVSAGRDDTSILIVLTARRLNPAIRIGVTIRETDNEDIAQQAGADTVINPVSFAGLLLATSISGSQVADYLSDLATTSGRVQLREREVRPEEVGQSATAIASGQCVRLIRGGRSIAPWEVDAEQLSEGDRILEIVQSSSG